MYYPSSENKDADQLRGYREADLRLCFRICKYPVFSRRGSFDVVLFWDFFFRHFNEGVGEWVEKSWLGRWEGAANVSGYFRAH